MNDCVYEGIYAGVSRDLVCVCVLTLVARHSIAHVRVIYVAFSLHNSFNYELIKYF